MSYEPSRHPEVNAILAIGIGDYDSANEALEHLSEQELVALAEDATELAKLARAGRRRIAAQRQEQQ